MNKHVYHVYEITHNERSYFCKEVDITNLCESMENGNNHDKR